MKTPRFPWLTATTLLFCALAATIACGSRVDPEIEQTPVSGSGHRWS